MRRTAHQNVHLVVYPLRGQLLIADHAFGAGRVTRDIPAAVVAFGNPAVPRRAVADLPDIDERVGREPCRD